MNHILEDDEDTEYVPAKNKGFILLPQHTQ